MLGIFMKKIVTATYKESKINLKEPISDLKDNSEVEIVYESDIASEIKNKIVDWDELKNQQEIIKKDINWRRTSTLSEDSTPLICEDRDWF